MKNYSTLKKFGLTAVTLLVCLAVVMTCFALSFPFARAFAEPEDPTTEEAVGAEVPDAVKIAETVVYGDDITVPAGAVVTAPDGTAATVTEGKVKADQMGIYTVSFGKKQGAYNFYVRVTFEEDLFLKVSYNGADIPTYIKKGDSFELPAAAVKFYDEDKILRTYDGQTDITVSVSGRTSTLETLNIGDTVTADQAGKMYVTYTARLDNGKKYFHQTFTVNVQESFSDVSDPTITVAGVSSDISIKRAVTIPQASASDSDDGNLKILITVKDPDGNAVKTVDLDEYGYAVQKDGGTYEEIEFDNDQAMTFYPVKTGDYYVSYQAIDDAGRKSAERQFKMTCGDHAAPVFVEIDEENIPETWGLSEVSKKDGDATVGEAGKLTFTVPTLVDNKSHVWTEGDESDDLIELYFRITDSDNNKTILSIEDVLSKTESKRKFVENTTYKANAEFTDGKFTFEFNKYNKTNSKGEEEELPGTYTVYWRASDKAGNRSSKSYTVNLQETYSDEVAPTVGDLDAAEYISTTEDGFTVPTPAVSDSADKRVKVEYKLYAGDISVDNESFIEVKGGENAVFEVRDGADNAKDIYLVIEDTDKELKLGADKKISFEVKAIDDVGNETVVTDVTNVIADVESEFTLNTDSVAFTALDKEGHSTTTLTAGKDVKAGDFKITTTAAMRNYTGFEVVAKDVNGDYINLDLETFTVFDTTADTATIYVKNIVLHPETAGKAFLIVRAFDVNGYNTIASEEFTLEEAESGNGSGSTQKSAAVIGKDNLVNVKYKLRNEVMENIGVQGGTYYVARKFSGRAFSLMGSEITFKSASTVYGQDGYIDAGATDIGNDSDFSGYDFDKHFNPYGLDNGKYTCNVTDTSKPVIEVQGIMPTYAEKGAEITLPSVVAFSDNGKAEVTLVVTHNKQGSKPKPVYDEATNTYTFKGELDATYTATYTATYGNSEPVSVSYTIDVGDVVGPDFKVTYDKELGRLRVGDKFTYGKIELLSDDKNNLTGITVKKRLIDPSKEEVSSATVSGSFSTYWDDVNNGTDIVLNMNGKYEVEYTVTDAAGNETVYREVINVASKGSAKPTTFTALSITLTVIAVVLLAGVIVYVVRFRKVKSK